MGRDRTIATMARHLRAKHPELTEAERDHLASRPWQPLPLANAFVRAPAP